MKIRFLLLAFFITFSPVYAAKNKYTVLTINAESEVKFEPTQFELSFKIDGFANNPDDSYKIYQDKSDKILKVLQAIPHINHLHTKSFNINPQYDYVERTKILKGYETSGSFNLNVDIEKIGLIVNVLAENNVNSLSNINFTAPKSVIEKNKNLAATNAVKNAITKVDKILEDLAANSYHIKEISVSETRIKRDNIQQRGMLLADESIRSNTILPQEKTINSFVTIKVEYQR